jgi:hypothetical protein
MLMVSVVVRFEKVRKPMDLVADEKEHFVQVGGVGGYGDNLLAPFVNTAKSHSEVMQLGFKACNDYLTQKDRRG